MKGKSVRDVFAEAWVRGIAFAEKAGASPGALRALRAYAEADVADTMAVLYETTFDNPVRGVAVSQAWERWYPAYAVAEVTRLLPELSVRWPGDRARWRARDQRNKLDRWCSDGEDVLAAIGARAVDGELVRKKLRLQKERFARLVDALVAVEAVTVWADGRMTATAGGPYVQEALRERWLGEGSEAPDWVDPLPEGCRRVPPSVQDEHDNR